MSTPSNDPIITTELVALDVEAGSEKSGVIAHLAGLVGAAGRSTDVAVLLSAALEREGKSATGLPDGIAIPHCRSAAVSAATLAFARLSTPVDFGAPDGPADIVFLIAAPESGGSQHMKLLAALARALVRKEFVAQLRAAADPHEVVDLVTDVIAPQPSTETAAEPAPAAAAASDASAGSGDSRMSLVAITACPTGIAHTYMAADALKQAAAAAGVDIAVETQGSAGATPLTGDQIAGADAVIFATDVGVRGRARFAGKPVIESGVKRAVNEPANMIAEAVAAADDPQAHRVSGSDGADEAATEGDGLGIGSKVRQVLMTGVSYMIPFVAAGGLLIALGFLIGGWELGNTQPGSSDPIGVYNAMHYSLSHLPDGGFRIYLGSVLFAIGKAAFFFLVPALAGYIAYAMADRPGLAPGFTAGFIASAVGAGFIGGLVGGVIAGFAALYVGRIPLPQWARGLQPVIIIPLLASMVTGLLMYMVLGRPLTSLTNWLQDQLSSMSGSSAILLGIVLGLMMCFDLGGPVNKAAYAFAVAGLSTSDPAQLHIMAAVMCAGMVPPLALGLATLAPTKVFSKLEKEQGITALPLGLCFITEGAIPFAAADPLRVIPPMMLGGAAAGATSMAFDAGLRAPHGGVFVFFAMTNAWAFFLALAVGVVVGAVGVLFTKTVFRPQPVAAEPIAEAVPA